MSLGASDILAIRPVAERLTGPIIPAGDAGLLLPLPSGTAVLMFVPRPLPTSVQIDDGIQRAARPGWHTASQAWRSHAILSMLNASVSLITARATASELLQLASHLADRVAGEGIGWDGSRLFFPAAMVRQMVARTPLPPELLVRLTGGGSSGIAGSIATTLGLGFFGLPELRDMTAGLDAEAVARRLPVDYSTLGLPDRARPGHRWRRYSWSRRAPIGVGSA